MQKTLPVLNAQAGFFDSLCIFSSTPIVFFYLITPPIKDSSFFTVFYRGSSS